MMRTPSPEVLCVVTDDHRRQILEWLREDGRSVATIEELIEGVREREGSSTTDVDRLRISVHHVHLPTLADHGIVDYDPAEGIVQYRADERVERALDVLEAELPKVTV